MPCTRTCKILNGGYCHRLILVMFVTIAEELNENQYDDGLERNVTDALQRCMQVARE